LEITDVPAHESGFSALALYRPRRGPTGAAFLMNTKAPEAWPRYVLPVLVAHEALPGHHLQDAAMQRRPIPAFRKHTYIVPYIEGWGLYAEALADEMGFYRSDLERLGMLLFDSWRTARLVVDTGIHAFGWTRDQACKYLREHTILADQDVNNEVERYFSQPGQAVAYKVGQLELMRLRREAEERLGAKFDVRSFHAALLDEGPTSLPSLDRRVERYVAARAAQQ